MNKKKKDHSKPPRKRIRHRLHRWCNVKQGDLPFLPTEVWILILHHFTGDWILHLIQHIGWQSHHPLICASLNLIATYLRVLADHLNYTSTIYNLAHVSGFAMYSNARPRFHHATRPSTELINYLPPAFPKYKLNNQLMRLYKSIADLPHRCWEDMRNAPIQQRMVNIMYHFFDLYMQHQLVHWALKRDVEFEDFLDLMIAEDIRGRPTGFSVWIWTPGYSYRFMVGLIVVTKPVGKIATRMAITRLYRAVYVGFDGRKKHPHAAHFGKHLGKILNYISKYIIRPRSSSLEMLIKDYASLDSIAINTASVNEVTYV